MIKNTLNNVQSFIKKCQENDLKITPQRIAIYEELKQIDHPSADNIYQNVKQKIPNISFNTVNRTLLTFSEVGIVDVVEGHGDPKRFDTCTETHHHFRCINCNRLLDIYAELPNDQQLQEELKERNLKVLKKRMVMEGLCDRCN